MSSYRILDVVEGRDLTMFQDRLERFKHEQAAKKFREAADMAGKASKVPA